MPWKRMLGIGAALLFAAFGPPLLVWAWLVYGHGGIRPPGNLDTPVCLISLGLGFTCLFALPMRPLWRVLTSTIYLIAMSFELFIVGAGTVCGYYHSCL